LVATAGTKDQRWLPDPAEWAARDAATNTWLDQTFDAAAQRRSVAVMLVIQGGFGFDAADPTGAAPRDPRTLVPQDGCFNFLRLLRAETIAFGKPVVLEHGDSHYLRIDKPVLDAAGNRIENFTRVETPGNNAQSGSSDARVDPRGEEVFSFQQEVVPANLPSYQP
jgi:hypothetical protein